MPASRRAQSEEKIRRLEAQPVRGLYAIVLFLAVSIVAGRGFDLLPTLSEGVRAWLGPPPPTVLISLALVVYSFSAAVLILGRMASGGEPSGGFSHVGYLTAFYAFYHLSQALPGNFWAVLAAGVTILSLQTYHLWTHCAERVRQERELLAAVERGEKLKADVDQSGS